MKTLLGILIVALLLMFGLPKLGLIAFSGGFLYAVWATLLVGFFSVVASISLLPWILGSLGIATVGIATGHTLFARFVVFGVQTAVMSVALAITAWVLSGVALVGFLPTIACGAILGVVCSIFHD